MKLPQLVRKLANNWVTDIWTKPISGGYQAGKTFIISKIKKVDIYSDIIHFRTGDLDN